VAVVKGVGGSVASIEELLAKRREWQAAPEGRPTPTLSADALKRLLKQLGAERVDANVNKETTLVVDADPINSMSMQTKNLVADCEKEQRTQFNVVAAEWLVQCFLEKQAGQEAPPLEPLYVRYATPDTRDAMGRIMDEWGDRYQQLATADSLKEASSLVKRRTLLGALGARPSVASAARLVLWRVALTPFVARNELGAEHRAGLVLCALVPVLIAVAYLTWAERKVLGAMQMRRGPNVVGPFGMGQPFADAIKMLMKEIYI
jgi:hypothetical protein